MYACMYVCMHACMYVCMYVCISLSLSLSLSLSPSLSLSIHGLRSDSKNGLSVHGACANGRCACAYTDTYNKHEYRRGPAEGEYDDPLGVPTHEI